MYKRVKMAEMEAKIDSLIKGSPRIDRENVDELDKSKLSTIAYNVIPPFLTEVDKIRLEDKSGRPNSILENCVMHIKDLLGPIGVRLLDPFKGRPVKLDKKQVEDTNREYKAAKYYIYGSIIEYVREGKDKIMDVDERYLKTLLPSIVTFFENYEAIMFKPSAGGKRRNNRSIRQRKSSGSSGSSTRRR